MPNPTRYSIDADPDGIRALVADAITGALAFGAQNTNPPPDGHWLGAFWRIARAEREQHEAYAEGSEQAFGDVVEEKRDLAKRCAEQQETIFAQQRIINQQARDLELARRQGLNSAA